MLNGPRPTRIEQIDWRSVLPWLRMWGNHSIAIRPLHMLLSFSLLVCVFIAVLILGAVFDRQATAGDIYRFAFPSLNQELATLQQGQGWQQLTSAQQAQMRMHLEHSRALGDVRSVLLMEGVLNGDREQRQGIFFASLSFKADAMQRLMAAVFSGDWQFGRLIKGQPPTPLSVAGVLKDLYGLCQWWITQHPLPLAIYSLIAYLLWIAFAGTLHRSIAVQAVKGERISLDTSLGFMRQRSGRLLLVPLIPGLLIGALALVLAAVGWLLSLDGLNVVGGLAMPIAVLAALLLVTIAVIYLGVMHLVLPAVAVDDADVFDAVSRSVHYVLTQPWRAVGYGVLALLHGMVTFALVGLIAWLALVIMQGIATACGAPAAMWPEPQYLQFFYWPDIDQLTGTQVFAGYMVGISATVLTLGVWAYAVSYYTVACTQVYLLLRLSSDLVDPTVLDGGVWQAPESDDDDEGHARGDDDDKD